MITNHPVYTIPFSTQMLKPFDLKAGIDLKKNSSALRMNIKYRALIFGTMRAVNFEGSNSLSDELEIWWLRYLYSCKYTITS